VMTQRYSHLSVEHLAEAVAVLVKPTPTPEQVTHSGTSGLPV
jgi:hypothetical protein